MSNTGSLCQETQDSIPHQDVLLSSVCVCVSLIASVVSDSVTPWTVSRQVPLSMRFSRQEYWSELPCPPPGDLPNSGIELGSPVLQEDCLPVEPPGKLTVYVGCIFYVYLKFNLRKFQ